MKKPQKGTVLALGTGKLDKDGKELPWNLKVGDKVFFKTIFTRYSLL